MTTSLTENTGTLVSPPRQLTDDVLQSAEEAVLANPAPIEGDPAQIQPPESEPATGQALLRYQDAVVRYVAEKPCQSALIAVAAGALAAAVLRSALQRRRR